MEGEMHEVGEVPGYTSGRQTETGKARGGRDDPRPRGGVDAGLFRVQLAAPLAHPWAERTEDTLRCVRDGGKLNQCSPLCCARCARDVEEIDARPHSFPSPLAPFHRRTADFT